MPENSDSDRRINLPGEAKQFSISTGDGSITYNFYGYSDETAAKLLKEIQAGKINKYGMEGVILNNLPFSQNPFFTGREKMLEKLKKSLTESSSAAISQPPAISGLGGIGKTQIAVEYAYRHMNEYKVVLWVNSEEVATITASFSEIARALDLREKNEKDIDAVVKAVKSWLNANEKWLLIFDNADKPDLIKGYQPRSRNGHILITSRAAAFGTLAEALEVDEMNSEDAVLFLLKRAKIKKPKTKDNETAGKIAKELGYLPLAIDQAGAFLEESQCSLNDYLDNFQKHGLEVLKDERYSLGDYRYTVATTWSMSLDQLKEENPGAVSILHLCSFFAPDAIPFELIKGPGKSFGQPLEDTVTDSLKFDRALSDLLKYSLVKRRKGANQFDIHRLLQAVIRDGLKQSEIEKYLNSAVISAAAVLPNVKDYRNWQECEKLTPHILSLARHTESVATPTKALAWLLNVIGYYLNDRADYERAELLFKRALEIYKKVHGPEHPHVATNLNNLAGLYCAQGKYRQAEPLHKRALEIREKVLDPEHPDIAQSLNNLAALYYDQGKYEQAEPLYKRALEIFEKVHGPEDPSVALSLNNLALLYHTQSKYEQAEPRYKRALKIYEKVRGTDHPEVATSLNNLAGLYDNQGKYEQAEPLYKHALEIDEKVHGADHPDVATDLNNLAGLYRAQGNYKQAEPLYKRSLEIREKVLGPEHPFVATSLNNLGTMLYEQGKKKEGIRMLQRAYKICLAKLGVDHPHTKTSLSYLQSWGVKPE